MSIFTSRSTPISTERNQSLENHRIQIHEKDQS
jgi:hypothetical protein